MMDQEIPRSNEHISRDVFATLFNLTNKQPWLVRRSRELFDTVGLCTTESERELLIDLISRFHFRSVQNHLDDLRALAAKITNDWKCLPENTILVALEDRELADSSAMLVQQLKGPLAELGAWKTGNFISQLGEVVRRTKNGSIVVFVDDFCGSGESIYKKVVWLRNELISAGKTATIRVAVGSSMEQSKDIILPVVDDFYSVHWLAKGLNDYFRDTELTEAVATMRGIEDKLGERHGKKKLSDYSFGWKQSEALFYLEGGNPPNNNFPVFWWPKLRPARDRATLLPRV